MVWEIRWENESFIKLLHDMAQANRDRVTGNNSSEIGSLGIGPWASKDFVALDQWITKTENGRPVYSGKILVNTPWTQRTFPGIDFLLVTRDAFNLGFTQVDFTGPLVNHPTKSLMLVSDPTQPLKLKTVTK
ncbi:MAG: hypothetical protein AAFN68_02035 [Pseudomonadota bacterium]